jgi:hypothetical protein
LDHYFDPGIHAFPVLAFSSQQAVKKAIKTDKIGL